MMDGWDWVWGGLMMVVFWGGLAALVVFAARGFGVRSSRGEEKRRGPNAQEILAGRYARGEISEDEFKQRRRVLEHSPV